MDDDEVKITEFTPVFVFNNFESNIEVEELSSKVRRLGGQIVKNKDTWDPRVTHVIAKTFAKSEIVLAGKCFNVFSLQVQICLTINNLRTCGGKMDPDQSLRG